MVDSRPCEPFGTYALPGPSGEPTTIEALGEKPLLLVFTNERGVGGALSALEETSPEVPILFDERGEVLWAFDYDTAGADGPFPAFVVARDDTVTAAWAGAGRKLRPLLER